MVRYDKSAAEQGRKWVRNRGSGGRIPGGGMAVGGVGGIITLLLALFLGTDVIGGSSSNIATEQPTQSSLADDNACDDGATQEYMCFLMGDLNTTWNNVFADYNAKYEPTYLNIFEGSVNTNGCGSASSAVGPFYCPAPQDKEVYIDLGFFQELDRKFGAPGDFAQAYVIAHEVGHHISNTSGDSDQIRQLQQQNPQGKNQYSVIHELQADCYAGIWAKDASGRNTSTGQSIIEPGDLEEGLEAAAAVGDDRIQSQAGQRVNPHNWTHGSAEQRQKAFLVGFETGSVDSCALTNMENVSQS